MEDKQPIGYLFDRIAFYSEESVSVMIDSLDKKTVGYILSQALEYSHSKNIFSLLESEVISKCLRIINKETFSEHDTTGFNTSEFEDNQA